MKRGAAKEQPEPADAAAGAAEAAGEESAPAAKRARTSKAKAPATKRKAAAAAVVAGEESSGEEPDEAAEAAQPARAKKPRSKAASKAGGGAAAAKAGEEAEEPQAAEPAKPKAKRGKKEPEPVLPCYTMAMRKPPPPEGSKALKILSWNVAGLRALVKKTPDSLSKLVDREGVDVVCLQEHKLQGDHTAELEKSLGLQGWSHHWACSTAKLGYSGVSVHTRTPPLSVSVGLGGPDGSGPEPDPEHEAEGRVVTVELPDLFVVCAYVPNSGEGLKRLDYRIKRWDGAFAAYITGLEARGKPVVLTGDLNCAHKEIDIHAPKTNLKSAGFTPEERESFSRLLLGEVGLVDTFRTLFPDTVAYTYFTKRFNCREKNKGWRLDYFLTSSTMMPEAAAPQRKAPAPPSKWRVYDSWILQDVYGPDHLPLGLTLVRNDDD
ncbi:hypothetical protein GPECTOR_1g467 [Gonium pectorale]|uniref:DNA-(apurinic or apyrimidinic site) endonuclease n=1 Tax=Gonium pectorale TaxID=33097 RepID=A0A150H4L1_GONPE|nr:hypothetical protein GPECTOR_1g467 [Gonium pectorale]|eukprot:KXZ56520.1 hypothetical protein GPECTOR_1g467 [Gonium pectorale]